MNIKPLFDRVVIRPKEEEKDKTGILILEKSKEAPQYGEVVAVGDGISVDYLPVEMKLKVGDIVFFNRFAGNEIKIEDENLIVIRQIDIVGVVKDV